jgi:Phosphate-selective porin O and P
MKGALVPVGVAVLLSATVATAQEQPEQPPGSPESPAGYNVPVKPAEPTPPEQRAQIDDSPTAADGHPLAGYHNGLFYLRDHHDNFHLYIQGRSQIDFYSYLGPGVSETALKPTLFLRRVRPEVTGEFLGHWRFMFAGDFGATAIDNPRGTNETSASEPGVAPTATTGRYGSAEVTRFQAAATDVFINYRQGNFFNVLVGQTDAPFMMENRTVDKFIPFMERSLPVRAVGIPSNKEIGAMVWGETSNRLFYYSAGPFNGDGQNRPNVDARFDVIGRLVLHPLATTNVGDKTLRDMQIGASGRYGSRDKKWVSYDYPVMTTQGAYAFWSPVYTGSRGPTHVIPSGDQLAVAGELRVPIDRFDLTSELVYIRNNTREALEGFEATNSERFGRIEGVSYYAMAGFWLLGKRDINGVPGYGNSPRLDWTQVDPLEPPQAVQLLVKWEQVSLKYDSAKRGGLPDAKSVDGSIRANALSFGANYWATKHVRLSMNYLYEVFPHTTQALHELHELLARIAIAL